MFCCVAETGSVARAAEQLHRAVEFDHRLRQLEQELGADLFIREKQRLRLSPMGHNFLCYANRIPALSDEAMSITHAGEPAGNFALGSMESTAPRPPALAAGGLPPALLAGFAVADHRHLRRNRRSSARRHAGRGAGRRPGTL